MNDTATQESALPRLHVDVHPGEGEPMLIVHGIFGGREIWSRNIEALRHHCTPVVVELFGHGRSPSPADPAHYRPEAYVAAFERIRTEIGAERWWLMGQSLGAALTLRYCLEHPTRVIGHVFTNSASALGDHEWTTRMRLDAETAAVKIERADRERLLASKMNPARSPRLDERVRAALAADEGLLDPIGLGNTVRATTPTASSRDRASANRVPTLLVAGTLEAGFDGARRFAETSMPQLRIVRLAVGHSPNAETPDVFNGLVTGFLRDVIEDLRASHRL